MLKTNTATVTTMVEQSYDDIEGDPNDVEMLESLDDKKNQ